MLTIPAVLLAFLFSFYQLNSYLLEELIWVGPKDYWWVWHVLYSTSSGQGSGFIDSFHQARGASLGFNTLKVHMSTLAFFFFPGHAHKRTLHVVVDHWPRGWIIILLVRSNIVLCSVVTSIAFMLGASTLANFT